MHTPRGQLDLPVELSGHGGIYGAAHLLRLCLRAVDGSWACICLTAGSTGESPVVDTVSHKVSPSHSLSPVGSAGSTSRILWEVQKKMRVNAFFLSWKRTGRGGRGSVGRVKEGEREGGREEGSGRRRKEKGRGRAEEEKGASAGTSARNHARTHEHTHARMHPPTHPSIQAPSQHSTPSSRKRERKTGEGERREASSNR